MAVPIIPIIAAVGGIIQGISGASQAKKARDNQAQLFSQRKAYQTPQEIFDILNMSRNNAQTGYSPDTLSYLTSQADIGLGSSLGTAERLGADPNQLGGIVDNYFQDIFRIGNENELLKLKKFDSLINATNLVASNSDAEYASRENILKDQLQTQAANLQAGRENIQSGINTIIGAGSAFETALLYGDENAPGLTHQQRKAIRNAKKKQNTPTTTTPTNP